MGEMKMPMPPPRPPVARCILCNTCDEVINVMFCLVPNMVKYFQSPHKAAPSSAPKTPPLGPKEPTSLVAW